MKSLKKNRTFLVLIFSLCYILIAPLLFTNSEVYAGEAFNTQNYDVKINVNEDNTFDVTEIIKVKFTSQRHGIFRNIPYSGNIVPRYKGKDYNMKAVMKIKDIDVKGHDVDISDENGQKVLKIGDPSNYVRGEQTYVISYKGIIYEDPFKEFDFIYWNVLPSAWPTPIDKANIVITLPKGVDKEKIEFFTGEYGERSKGLTSWDAKILADGKMVINASAKNIGANEGITIYSILPQGYFRGAANFNFYVIGIIAFAVLMAFFAFLIWFRFGRDPKIIKTVEFYPPNDLDPVQIGYMIDKSVGNQEMVALLIYMANKGYLDIEEVKNAKNKVEDFTLIQKSVPSSGEKPYVKKLYDEIFENGERVSYENLDIDFWEKYRDIMLEAAGSAEAEDRKLYNKKSLKSGLLCGLTNIIGIAAIFLLAVVITPLKLLSIFSGILFVILSLANMIYAFYIVDRKDYYTKRKFAIMTLIGWGIGIVATGMASLMTHGGIQDWKPGLIFGIAQMITVFFGKYGRAFSNEGIKLYGRVLGFKEYLKTAEIDKLKALVESDPAYFYNIIPYAYILGLSDKWISKFKTIDVVKPEWGRNMDALYMGNFLLYANSRSASGVNTYIQSISDSNSSSSGFGGGGFSGGGFGGGGGGSW